MTDEQLKGSNIFELTDHASNIEAVIGFLPQKELYIQSATIEAKAIDMLTYAEYIKDVVLQKQLQKVFKKELALLFNE